MNLLFAPFVADCATCNRMTGNVQQLFVALPHERPIGGRQRHGHHGISRHISCISRVARYRVGPCILRARYDDARWGNSRILPFANHVGRENGDPGC